MGTDDTASAGRQTDDVVRALIVDDHAVFSSSLAYALDAEPDIAAADQVNSLAAAAEYLRSHPVDVVLVDHRLPDGDGASAIGALREIAPAAKFLMLTGTDTPRVLRTALESGAVGFLTKTSSLSDVVAAVRAVAQGGTFVSPDALSRMLPSFTRPTLSEREQEVLELIAQGKSNADIAAELVISINTVRNHVANLSTKLGAHSKLEAVTIARREGLVRD